MRSRYSAYVRGDTAYVRATWHSTTRPPAPELAPDPATRWLGLEVRRTEGGGVADGAGVVEFVARLKRNGRAERLHEVSRFVREQGRWYYVDGRAP